jgi:diadenylate cyclase
MSFLESILRFNIHTYFPLSSNIYISDFLDVTIIAILLYTLFIFFKSTKANMVLVGILIAFGLYVLSKTLNLYLTFITLRYFVGVSLVILVIIFQNEIRKYFEFLGLVGSRQIKVGPFTPKSPSTTELVQACVQMAQANIGALIVIQGKDALDSFLEGGTELDGIISEDIIHSIFDPHSDGHDGALIISNNRIVKFGAHLPLSTNFREIGKHGTRHGAALGLAENSDALCIIVSEEKGKISVAREGKLKTLTQFDDLQKEVEKFIKAKFTQTPKRTYGHFIKHNLSMKVLAAVVAMIIWFFTAYQAGISQKTFDVPVVFSEIPQNSIIEDLNPKTVKVTLTGRGDTVFSDISEDNLSINLDIDTLQTGVNKKEISRKNINLPANISMVEFDPPSVLLTAKKYFTVKVPVSIKTTGTLEEGFEITDILATPDTVELQVLQDTQPPAEIATEEIDISKYTDSVIIPIKIILPTDTRLLNGTEQINVAFTIEKTE